MRGLKKHKIKADNELIVSTDLSKVKTEQAMQQLLELKSRPQAVIAFNDYVALDAIRYTRNQGLKINKDVYFVSYANLPITNYLDEPPVASVEQFPYQQAEKATQILLQLIEAKGINDGIPKKLILESKVVLNKHR
jgi:LacI family repressor for deo operon, udp, cdd, tsx, nupC, and nupG